MSFVHRYIDTAEKVILGYDGTLPLHYYLKQFFAADKKYGSKDRKQISHAVYCYYRLGKASNENVAEKIKTGLFLCNDVPGKWGDAFDENWISNWSKKLAERISFVQSKTDVKSIFPFSDEVSEKVDKLQFTFSHLIQPDLYLRIRPGKTGKVKKQLVDAGILYQQCNDACLALPNGTKINQLLQLNKDVVVQDFSSQQVGGLMMKVPEGNPLHVWDCCAASGGKSILAYDIFESINLTVSDVRASIIANLKRRFKEAGINRYHSFVADIARTTAPVQGSPFNLIICDVPCSGSGTWSRTPEQLSFFNEEKIEHYASLQKKITSAVLPSLATNGYLLYITCSVFYSENEAIVAHLLSTTSLELVELKYLEGYHQKADTMFAALFIASTP